MWLCFDIQRVLRGYAPTLPQAILSVLKLYSVLDAIIIEYRAGGGMIIGKQKYYKLILPAVILSTINPI
jgi:hypothetical protein